MGTSHMTGLRAVALSDWADATSSSEVHNWTWSLRHRLSDLGYDLRVAERCMERINVDYVLQQHDARELQCWETCDVCLRTCPSEGASLCRYHRWLRCLTMPGSMPSFVCHCGSGVSFRSSGLGWGAMSSPLRCCAVRALEFPARIGFACIAISAPQAMSSTCCLSARLLRPLVRLTRPCFRPAALCWSP